MALSNRSARWLQIILTLLYGQILSLGIYEYLVQGICGLILGIRPKYDAIVLLLLGLLMFAFVLYALVALWLCRTRMSVITLLILLVIFALTIVRSILEINHMGLRAIRLEWTLIRVTELVIRFLTIIASLVFLLHLRQGYKPERLSN